MQLIYATNMRLSILTGFMVVIGILTHDLEGQSLQLRASWGPQHVLLLYPADSLIDFIEISGGKTKFTPPERSYPQDSLEFKNRYFAAAKLYPHLNIRSEESLNEFWTHFKKNRDLGPSLFPQFPPVLIAAGLALHVPLPNEQNISAIKVTTSAGQIYNLTRPTLTALQIKPFSTGTDGKIIHLTWYVKDQMLASAKVFRKETQQTSFLEVKAFSTVFYQKDTAFLQIRDTVISADPLIYHYYIQPIDWMGNVYAASPVITTDNFTQLNAPQVINFQVSGLTDRRAIKLSWEIANAERVTNLLIFRSTQAEQGYHKIMELNPAIKTYEDAVPLAGEAYHYFIGARDIHGELSVSIRKFGLSKFVEIPLPPGELRGFNDGNTIRLDWVNQDPYTLGFRIYRYLSGGDPEVLISFLPLDTARAVQEFVDTSFLASLETYTYLVRTINDSYTESNQDQPIYLRPHRPVITYKPSLQIIENGGCRHLVWFNPVGTNVDGVSGFSIWRSTSPAQIDSLTYLVAPANHYTDCSVMHDTCSYYVRYHDFQGYTVETPPVSFIPDLEDEFLPTVIGKKHEDHIYIQWNSHEQVIKTEIVRAVNHQHYEKLAELNNQVKNYRDFKIKSGTQYTYVVHCIFSDGSQKRSKPISFSY